MKSSSPHITVINPKAETVASQCMTAVASALVKKAGSYGKAIGASQDKRDRSEWTPLRNALSAP